MQSILDPSVLYTNLSRDVCEHDVDVVSDLWNIDERDVYRGSRDTHYTHANVYWLYDEDLVRMGLIEHSLANHADFRVLWFYDNPFATLLQEEGWTQDQSLWSVLPQTTVERFFQEEWTTPELVLTACLYGDVRIVTLNTVLNPPMVYGCSGCNTRSLHKLACQNMEQQLTYPVKEKIVFIDDDMFVCVPPSGSRVWELVGFKSPPRPHDDASALQEQMAPENSSEQEELKVVEALQHQLPAPETPQPEAPVLTEEHPPVPPQSQTALQQTLATEQTPVRTRFATSLRTPVPKRRYSE